MQYQPFAVVVEMVSAMDVLAVVAAVLAAAMLVIFLVVQSSVLKNQCTACFLLRFVQGVRQVVEPTLRLQVVASLNITCFEHGLMVVNTFRLRVGVSFG